MCKHIDFDAFHCVSQGAVAWVCGGVFLVAWTCGGVFEVDVRPGRRKPLICFDPVDAARAKAGEDQTWQLAIVFIGHGKPGFVI